MMLDPNKSIILSSSSGGGGGNGSEGNTIHGSGRSRHVNDNKSIRIDATSSDEHQRNSLSNSSSSTGDVLRHDYLNGHKENMRSVASEHHSSSSTLLHNAHRGGSSSEDQLLASSHMLTSYLQVSSIDAVESTPNSNSIGPSVVGDDNAAGMAGSMEGILNLLQTVKRLGARS